MVNVSIIGIGLIGGSMALELKSQLNVKVVGVEKNTSHQEIALNRNLVDEISELETAVKLADIIVVSTSVDKIETVLCEVLDHIKPSATVIDVGSTKNHICQAIANHPMRNRFVACHPLAGTENSGPNAAIRNLFMGKKNIICEKEKSDLDAVDTAVKLFESFGMKSYYLSPEDHDKHLAYVSHLSHISSFTLGLTVLDIEKDEHQIMNLASTGFSSTVRLAKSLPETWAPILDKNAVNICSALDQYIKYLHQFKTALSTNDTDRLYELMKNANKIKDILKPS